MPLGDGAACADVCFFLTIDTLQSYILVRNPKLQDAVAELVCPLQSYVRPCHQPWLIADFSITSHMNSMQVSAGCSLLCRAASAQDTICCFINGVCSANSIDSAAVLAHMLPEYIAA